MLLNYDALVNDGPTATGNVQSETSTIVFTPAGADAPRVITAFNDLGAPLDQLTGYSIETTESMLITHSGPSTRIWSPSVDSGTTH